MEKIEEEDKKDSENEQQSTFYSSMSTASATVISKFEMKEMNLSIQNH